jgi:hypothetical protein
MASYKRILGGWARTDASGAGAKSDEQLPVVGRRIDIAHASPPEQPSDSSSQAAAEANHPQAAEEPKVHDEPRYREESTRGKVVEVDVEAVEQLRHQARQLAVHLREKQDELDRREAEWQSQLATFDNDRRAAQVWYVQRCRELEDREAAIPIRERELANQRELLIAAEAASVQVRQNDEAALLRKAETLEAQAADLLRREAELEQLQLEAVLETAARRHAAAEVEARRAELQAEMERLRDQYAELEVRREAIERLANEPSKYQIELQQELNARESALDGREAAVVEQEENLKQATLEWQRLRAELSEERERLAAQQRHDRLELAELRRRAEAEAGGGGLERQPALERRSEELDFRRAAIRREQEDLAAAQHETLEMRLAAEELWTRLSGTLPTAALTEQMARIRSRLSEQYRIVQTDLAAQKAELEALRADLAAEVERLRFQTEELHRWAEARHEEIERQAAFLTGREAELERQDGALYQRSQAWRQERFQLEHEIRRLQGELRRSGAAA